MSSCADHSASPPHSHPAGKSKSCTYGMIHIQSFIPFLHWNYTLVLCPCASPEPSASVVVLGWISGGDEPSAHNGPLCSSSSSSNIRRSQSQLFWQHVAHVSRWLSIGHWLLLNSSASLMSSQGSEPCPEKPGRHPTIPMCVKEELPLVSFFPSFFNCCFCCNACKKSSLWHRKIRG